MIEIILCVIVLIIFVADSQTVISGASSGLMLWYKNVLPILLPFMLISGILVRHINNMDIKKSGKRSFGIFTTIILGILCGYPLGAKTASDFVINDTYNVKTGSMLLPLCNNSSPMFISGYIVHSILNDSITIFTAIFLIYLPYLVLILFNIIIDKLYRLSQYGKNSRNFKKDQKKYQKNRLNTDNTVSTKSQASNSDPMLTAIRQITFVGVYIMLCSIIIEFVRELPSLHEPYFTYIAGITEITRGTIQIKCTDFLSESIKTALILAMTSFGGISSILQTNKVISSSGLSIIRYIFAKIVCASGTFFLALLLI